MSAVTPTCLAPVARPTRPRVTLPPGAWDAHCHVFGPHARYPFSPGRPFTPPDAPLEQLRALHDFLGLSRALLVQSNVHGHDHSALLAALRGDQQRYRGVALLSPDAPPRLADELHEAGVRGTRVHLVAHFGGAPPQEEVLAVASLVQRLGWHLELHVSGPDLVDHYPLIAALPGPLVIDHLGRVDLADAGHSAADALIRLLDRGDVWVKVSGLDRISLAGPPYADAVALARSLAGHAPRRVLWGTDYPHPNKKADMPDDGVLVDLIAQIAPGPDARRLMLIDNPNELLEIGGSTSR
jgi:2-pyrone-4,6-dicarboxylate lactonase